MNLTWMSVNPKLKEGIELINAVNISKFTLLLQHIIIAKDENIFTPEELKKLESSLGLNSINVQLLLHSITYMFKQSSKVVLKPTVLQKQLVEELKFNLNKAEEFVKIWTKITKENFGNLDNQQKLNGVSWEVNLQTQSSVKGKELQPYARFKLGLSGAENSQTENVIFQMNNEELSQLYYTLENIQKKLDFIQSAKGPN